MNKDEIYAKIKLSELEEIERENKVLSEKIKKLTDWKYINNHSFISASGTNRNDVLEIEFDAVKWMNDNYKNFTNGKIDFEDYEGSKIDVIIKSYKNSNMHLLLEMYENKVVNDEMNYDSPVDRFIALIHMGYPHDIEDIEKVNDLETNGNLFNLVDNLVAYENMQWREEEKRLFEKYEYQMLNDKGIIFEDEVYYNAEYLVKRLSEKGIECFVDENDIVSKRSFMIETLTENSNYKIDELILQDDKNLESLIHNAMDKTLNLIKYENGDFAKCQSCKRHCEYRQNKCFECKNNEFYKSESEEK